MGAEVSQPDDLRTAAGGRKENYTYMLRCGDGSFYIGWTNDLEKRLRNHESGRGGKYTRTHLPVKLVYYECFETPREARVREAALKKLTHAGKEKLLSGQETFLL